jgi:hypothetical protein
MSVNLIIKNPFLILVVLTCNGLCRQQSFSVFSLFHFSTGVFFILGLWVGLHPSRAFRPIYLQENKILGRCAADKVAV